MKFTFQPESRPLDGYTLKRGIARGGFGEVYYALSDAGKEVAVKLLQHNLDVELRGVQQCLNLRHPNLVTIFDVRTDADDDHWVVMEYIGGQTLEQVLQSNPGPMPIDQIERWLKGLCGGLAYLHDRGIVHRDVKPGNVFWDQGSVKLGDIGLSKFMTPSRRSAHTESVGTVYYMAPEVSYGKYGYEVDVYSVGIMLYEMLTGKLPFDGQSTGEILMKHLSEPPDLAIVPAVYRPLLTSALEKDPKQRTGSMQRLLDDFLQARNGVAVHPAESRPSGFAKWIPPANLPEPAMRQTAHPVSGRVSGSAQPSPAAVPFGGHTAAFAGTLSGGVNQGHNLSSPIAFAAICVIGPLVLYYFAADGRSAYGPLNWLLYWPCAFAILRLVPLVRTPSGYRPISIDPLMRSLERDQILGTFIREFRSWTHTPAGYWIAWMGLYLGIQIPLFMIAGAFHSQPDTGHLESLFLLMATVFGLTTYLRQPRFASNGSRVSTESHLPPSPSLVTAQAANHAPGERPAGARPGNAVAAEVGRQQRAGFRPPPAPLPKGIWINLKLADLTRSLNWATILTLIFGLGTGFLSPLFGAPGSLQPDWGKLGLFTLTTLVGVWAVLISSHGTSDKPGSGNRNRLMGLLSGIAVGSAAWWLSQFLLVQLAVDQRSQHAFFSTLGRQPLESGGEPTWLAFCIFFGLLFALRRWWWHAHPMRPALFRISSVILTVCVAAVLSKIFLFPFDWAITWAAVMSCVVQLSAAWIPPEARTRR